MGPRLASAAWLALALWPGGEALRRPEGRYAHCAVVHGDAMIVYAGHTRYRGKRELVPLRCAQPETRVVLAPCQSSFCSDTTALCAARAMQ